MKSIIKIDRVGKVIKNKTILSEVSMEIEKGEIFGLIGPNGAGKTTLMKLMCGLSAISYGNIYIDGQSLIKYGNTVCTKVGALIENVGAYEKFSGFKNLRLLANMYDNVKDTDIYEIVDMVDLKDAIHNKVNTYSLGMRQRLGIAMALLNNPKVLILDEPMNGIDIDGVRDMRAMLDYLAKEKGVTVIISSHILGEMDKLCDRAAFIKNGKVVGIAKKETMQSSGFEDEYVKLVGSEVRQFGVN